MVFKELKVFKEHKVLSVFKENKEHKAPKVS